MSRRLLGSLGLALGVFVSPVVGQDARTQPPQHQRSAKLGRPVAIPDTPAGDSNIQPAGLLDARRGRLASPTPIRRPAYGSPSPQGGYPSYVAAPISGMPLTGVPVTTQQPMPGGMGQPSPKVVEDRAANGATGSPPGGTTTPMPGVPTLVPSVAPQLPPGATIVPGSEGVVYGDCPTGDCPIAAPDCGEPVCPVNRVLGCGRWWVRGEYLAWWTTKANVPPLVTTSSPAANGQLGVGDTQVLLGGQFGATFHSGGRIEFGRWFGNEQRRGVEGRLFFLGQAGDTFAASTDQFPLLARPFTNVNPNTPFFGSSSQVIADSTRAMGGVMVRLENTVWGAEANYRRFLWGTPCARIDGIVGYRYLNMNENLIITEQFVRTPMPIGTGFPATSGVVIDQFYTENHFHGGQIGLTGELRRGRWTLDTRATIAFGNLQRTATISGSQNLTLIDGSQAIAAGGLLAIPGANIGTFTDNQFAVIPEVGINVGYQLTSRLRVYVGYNFMFLGNALRPQGTIDTGLDAARIPNFLFPDNPAPIPGTPRPQPQFRSSEFAIQGINFGLQFTW